MPRMHMLVIPSSYIEPSSRYVMGLSSNIYWPIWNFNGWRCYARSVQLIVATHKLPSLQFKVTSDLFSFVNYWSNDTKNV